jgi:hypothetical protein
LPLSEKSRVEVYIPDIPSPAYHNLLDTLEQEFTYTFGGCTTVRGLHGSYLSIAGFPIEDRVNLIYTDAPIRFDHNKDLLSSYTDDLLDAAVEDLEEEAVLVVACQIHHSGR